MFTCTNKAPDCQKVNFLFWILNLLLFLVCFQWNSERKEILLTTSLYYKFSLIWQKTYLLMTNFPLSILSHPQRNGSSSLIFLPSILAQASCTHCPQSVHSTITASMPGLAFDINAQHAIPSKAHSSKWAPNGPGRHTAGTTCRNDAYLQNEQSHK